MSDLKDDLRLIASVMLRQRRRGAAEITIWSSDYLSEGEISLRVKSIMSPGKQSPPALASRRIALGALWACTSPTGFVVDKCTMDPCMVSQ